MSTTPIDPQIPRPQAVQRLDAWLWAPIGIQMLITLPLVVPPLAAVTYQAYETPSKIAILAVTTLNFGLLVVYVTRWSRMKREVRASSGNACTFCAHSLTGLADSGVCPECGKAFVLADARRAWNRANMGSK